MSLFKQSEATDARRWIMFRCIDDDSADAYAPKTGLTFSSGELKVAKAGAAFANAANFASVVEAGNGRYWYQFAAAELDTLGEVALVVDKTDVYADDAVGQVVAFDPYSATSLGLTNVDATVSSRLASSDYENLETMLDDADTVETGLTLRGFFKDAAAALFGETANGGTQMKAAKTAHKVRITSTVSGNDRTSVTTDET